MPNAFTGRKRRSPSASDDLEPRVPTKKAKQSATASADALPAAGSGANLGEVQWELAGMKRVSVSDFKGKTLVGIREFYSKDGQNLPGKKGISLPVETFGKIVTLLPQIEAALAARGEHLPRPVYDEQDPPHAKNYPSQDAESRASKQNFEETSEDDG